MRGPRAEGTIHLSVADRYGGLVALTLTHGNTVTADKGLPEAHRQHFRKIGYDVRAGSVAVVHAVEVPPGTGDSQTASR